MESQIEGEYLPSEFSNVVPPVTSSLAIENSWTTAFVGQSPLNGLRDHILQLLESEIWVSGMPIYERYCPIVQSSRMGKLRLIDEFSKKYFLIPVNLRARSDRGTYYHLLVL